MQDCTEVQGFISNARPMPVLADGKTLVCCSIEQNRIMSEVPKD